MYGLGQMMMGGSAADGAPQMPPGLFGNTGMGGGNSIAQMLLAGRGQNINPAAPEQAAPKKKGFLEQFLLGGGLGLLPAYLAKQL